MYIYNSQGQKMPVVENFMGFAPKTKENYSDNSKNKKIMKMVLIVLAVILVAVAIYMIYKYMNKSKNPMGFRRSFGFRFY